MKRQVNICSLHVESYVRSIYFVCGLIICMLFCPKEPWPSIVKTLLLLTVFYPIYHHPEAVSADPMTSKSAALPGGRWWARLFHLWKCWGSFQPRWPPCWSCLRAVFCCCFFCFYFSKVAYLIQDIYEVVWSEPTKANNANNKVELWIVVLL